MTAPVLTPRLARENDWRIAGACDKCRLMKVLHVETLFQRSPDRDLGEALVHGKITCTTCKRPCSSLYVSRQHVGRIIAVMELTAGLTVIRHEGDGAEGCVTYTPS